MDVALCQKMFGHSCTRLLFGRRSVLISIQILAILTEVSHGFTLFIQANIWMSLPFLPNRFPALSCQAPRHVQRTLSAEHAASCQAPRHVQRTLSAEHAARPLNGLCDSVLCSYLTSLAHPKYPAIFILHSLDLVKNAIYEVYILGAFAWSSKAPTSFIVSIPVCPSACISAVTTGRISVKCDTGDIYENVSRKAKLG
jgi:hypothetical protein